MMLEEYFRFRRETTSYFVSISFLVLGIILFGRGFFLTRVEIGTQNSCDSIRDYCSHYSCSVDTPFTHLSDGPDSTFCWGDEKYDRVVYLVIDAWRYDFAKSFHANGDHAVKPYHNQMPKLNNLLHHNEVKSQLFQVVADAPTVTMQRLKGLTSGSLPTFSDAAANFGSPEITEDNLITQMCASGPNSRSCIFAGDDTWMSLFPRQWRASYPYPSFNVWDLDTVDYGVEKHLWACLDEALRVEDYDNGGYIPNDCSRGGDDWDVFVGHFLGLDHAGHRFGPTHPALHEKLTYMDNILDEVVSRLEEVSRIRGESILLVAIGDHGMDEGGNHGGATRDETNAAAYLHSFGRPLLSDLLHTTAPGIAQRKKSDDIYQVDLVPTLALLLGVPIPFANIGQPIQNLYWSPTRFADSTNEVMTRFKSIALEAISESSTSRRTILLSELVPLYFECLEHSLVELLEHARVMIMGAIQISSYLEEYSLIASSIPIESLSEYRIRLQAILSSHSASYHSIHSLVHDTILELDPLTNDDVQYLVDLLISVIHAIGEKSTTFGTGDRSASPLEIIQKLNDRLSIECNENQDVFVKFFRNGCDSIITASKELQGLVELKREAYSLSQDYSTLARELWTQFDLVQIIVGIVLQAVGILGFLLTYTGFWFPRSVFPTAIVGGLTTYIATNGKAISSWLQSFSTSSSIDVVKENMLIQNGFLFRFISRWVDFESFIEKNGIDSAMPAIFVYLFVALLTTIAMGRIPIPSRNGDYHDEYSPAISTIGADSTSLGPKSNQNPRRNSFLSLNSSSTTFSLRHPKLPIDQCNMFLPIATFIAYILMIWGLFTSSFIKMESVVLSFLHNTMICLFVIQSGIMARNQCHRLVFHRDQGKPLHLPVLPTLLLFGVLALFINRITRFTSTSLFSDYFAYHSQGQKSIAGNDTYPTEESLRTPIDEFAFDTKEGSAGIDPSRSYVFPVEADSSTSVPTFLFTFGPLIILSLTFFCLSKYEQCFVQLLQSIAISRTSPTDQDHNERNYIARSPMVYISKIVSCLTALASTSRFKRRKYQEFSRYRSVLWLLPLVQCCLLSCYWIVQSHSYNRRSPAEARLAEELRSFSLSFSGGISRFCYTIMRLLLPFSHDVILSGLARCIIGATLIGLVLVYSQRHTVANPCSSDPASYPLTVSRIVNYLPQLLPFLCLIQGPWSPLYILLLLLHYSSILCLCVLSYRFYHLNDKENIQGTTRVQRYRSPIQKILDLIFKSLLPSVALLFHFAVQHHWYGMSRGPSFSRIAYNAGFVGFSDFSLFSSGSLVILNTFTPHILLSFFTPVLNEQFQFSVQGVLVIPSLLVTFATSVFSAISRRHLMVWAIFAPKFVFDACLSLVSLFIFVSSMRLCFTKLKLRNE